jgi:hypothetical protein
MRKASTIIIIIIFAHLERESARLKMGNGQRVRVAVEDRFASLHQEHPREEPENLRA